MVYISRSKYTGVVYSATVNAVGVTAAQDFFSILASANNRIRVREVRIGQYSDFGDAQAEIISVSLVRGNTVAGSVGSSVTPQPFESWTAATSDATVRANDTTVASGGSPVTLIADVFNVAAGWYYRPDEDERVTLKLSERLCVRITAPADSLTMNGTIVWEEIGKGAT